MSQSGYTPILIYGSGTAANVPLAANLTSSALGAELALNYADGKLYYKNSAGVVTLLAQAASASPVTSFQTSLGGLTPATSSTGAITLAGTLNTSSGGTGLTSFTAGDLPYYATGTALSKLGIGTANQVLTSSGTAPQWSSALTVTGLTDSGNLTFTGTGNRITGDFSNATLANRVFAQTSTANTNTTFGIIPSGTGTTANFGAYSSSDPTNASVMFVGVNTSVNEVRLQSSIAGTGTYLPMTFYTGGSEAVRIGSGASSATDKGTVGIGYSSLTGVGNNGLAVLGNVGIGTSSPNGKLAVLPAANPTTVATSTTLTLGETTNNSAYQLRMAYSYLSTVYTGVIDAVQNSLGAPLAINPTGGNVGIGTSSPSYKLQVNGVPFIQNPNAGANNVSLYIGTSFTSINDTGLISWGDYSTGSTINYVQAGMLVDVGAAGAFVVRTKSVSGATNPTERMRIDSSGNVGIGTTSPGNKLVTASNAANSKIEIQNTSTAASTSKTSALQFTGTDTAGTLKDSGDIFVTPADNNYVGSNMLFYTRGSDTTAERMRIDSSGNVLVTFPAGLGYGTGSGGTVTQATSKSTAVTLNKPTGQITMSNAALAAGVAIQFQVSCSVCGLNDTGICNLNGVGVADPLAYQVYIRNVNASGFVIVLKNISAGSLSEAVVINFAIIKGATS